MSNDPRFFPLSPLSASPSEIWNKGFCQNHDLGPHFLKPELFQMQIFGCYILCCFTFNSYLGTSWKQSSVAVKFIMKGCPEFFLFSCLYMLWSIHGVNFILLKNTYFCIFLENFPLWPNALLHLAPPCSPHCVRLTAKTLQSLRKFLVQRVSCLAAATSWFPDKTAAPTTVKLQRKGQMGIFALPSQWS